MRTTEKNSIPSKNIFTEVLGVIQHCLEGQGKKYLRRRGEEEGHTQTHDCIQSLEANVNSFRQHKSGICVIMLRLEKNKCFLSEWGCVQDTGGLILDTLTIKKTLHVQDETLLTSISQAITSICRGWNELCHLIYRSKIILNKNTCCLLNTYRPLVLWEGEN